MSQCCGFNSMIHIHACMFEKLCDGSGLLCCHDFSGAQMKGARTAKNKLDNSYYNTIVTWYAGIQ